MKDGDIGHWILEEKYGSMMMRIQCPCGIWVNGPNLIKNGEVHLWETWPLSVTYELVALTDEWIKRIAPFSEVPLLKIHVHLEIVNLSAEPDFEYSGTVTYFKGGKALDNREFVGGDFDAVLICLKPTFESLWEVEWILVHELLHVAFPSGGVDWSNVMENISEMEPKSEAFIEGKTDEFLLKFGSLRARRRRKKGGDQSGFLFKD
jgi:hypothetical protein